MCSGGSVGASVMTETVPITRRKWPLADLGIHKTQWGG